MTTDTTFTFESTNGELETARKHVRQGNLAEAERVYRQIASAQPDQLEALRFLANAALSRGDPGTAVGLLSRVAQADHGDIGVLLELGVAYRNADRMDEARSVFERALEQTQGRDTTARLLMANVLELDKRPDTALLHYFRAILDAQAKRQWRDESSTEPGLRPLVLHAMQYVDAGRRELFQGVLEPFRGGINAARLGRVDTALANYLHDKHDAPADPRQRPTFLYLPDVGAKRFMDTTSFGWLGDWSSRATCLDDEALACLGTAQAPAPAVFSFGALAATTSAAAGATPRELAMPLYQRGASNDAIRDQAPRLFGIIDQAPLVRIPRYGPDVSILALQPGTHAAVRYGRSNAFCTVVAAFSGSAPMQVTVGGETRPLAAGQAVVFDSSFDFEFATHGDVQALALVLEVWNPEISQLEQQALGALATAAVNFDERLQGLA